MKSIRPAMLSGFIITASMIAIALFMQYQMDLEPCPLCLVQRAVVIILSFILLLGFIQGPATWGRRIYGFLLSMVSILGMVLAGRHSWLQHLPEDRIPECGPGLEYWIDHLHAVDIVQKVFQGTGECAKVTMKFAGLSIPEWSLIVFTLFTLFSLKLLFKGR